jgi:hypothetical protein
MFSAAESEPEESSAALVHTSPAAAMRSSCVIDLAMKQLHIKCCRSCFW